MRKPPELLVTIASTALVTSLVLGFGFMMGGDGDSARKVTEDSTATPSVSTPAAEPALKDPLDSTARRGAAGTSTPAAVEAPAPAAPIRCQSAECVHPKARGPKDKEPNIHKKKPVTPAG